MRVTSVQRKKWLRRAETIQRKAEELLDDMLRTVGEEHPITDKADNVVAECQELTTVLDKPGLEMWKDK